MTQTTVERAKEFLERAAVQTAYSAAFVRCPACHGNVSCAHCIGTRKVTRATRRQLVADADAA